MRYVLVPSDVTVPGAILSSGAPLVLALSQFIEHNICTASEWRQNADWMGAYFEVVEAFRKAKAGEWVELSDSNHEKIIAVFKNFQVKESLLMFSVMELMRPVVLAPMKKPEETVVSPPVHKSKNSSTKSAS